MNGCSELLEWVIASIKANSLSVVGQEMSGMDKRACRGFGGEGNFGSERS